MGDTLRQLIMDDWETIDSTLCLHLEKKKENMLLMMSKFRPLLEDASKIFTLPSIAEYFTADQKYRGSLDRLAKMGYIDKDRDSYALTQPGVHMMERYMKSVNPDFETEQELISRIIGLADHLSF